MTEKILIEEIEIPSKHCGDGCCFDLAYNIKIKDKSVCIRINDFSKMDDLEKINTIILEVTNMLGIHANVKMLEF